MIVQIFKLTNAEYVGDFVKSFSASFLEQGTKTTAQLVNDILACLDHPAGFEVFDAFVQNDYIPLHYKFQLAYLLKGHYSQLVQYRLGKLFVRSLVWQLRNRLQIKSDAYGLEKASVEINLDTMKMICYEIGDPRRVRLLRNSNEGQELINTLALDQYSVTPKVWESDTLKHLQKLERRLAPKKSDLK